MSGAVKHAYEIVQKVPQPTLTAESTVPSHSHYTPLARPQSVHNHYTVTPHRNVPLHTPARLNHKHDTGSSTCEGPQQSTRISQRMGAARPGFDSFDDPGRGRDGVVAKSLVRISVGMQLTGAPVVQLTRWRAHPHLTCSPTLTVCGALWLLQLVQHRKRAMESS